MQVLRPGLLTSNWKNSKGHCSYRTSCRARGVWHYTPLSPWPILCSSLFFYRNLSEANSPINSFVLILVSMSPSQWTNLMLHEKFQLIDGCRDYVEYSSPWWREYVKVLQIYIGGQGDSWEINILIKIWRGINNVVRQNKKYPYIPEAKLNMAEGSIHLYSLLDWIL